MIIVILILLWWLIDCFDIFIETLKEIDLEMQDLETQNLEIGKFFKTIIYYICVFIFILYWICTLIWLLYLIDLSYIIELDWRIIKNVKKKEKFN